ncbi:PD40 domain-containing protein [Capnocytophaga canimorsus]|uniref:PD40 domain-containing protein n=1 Tax=Capnocytophaga canimorsus TaxID=28188 RepID=UPI0015620CD5|nr:PD40 domain-containing protein [Capnocytophaga canimorsus]
MKKILIIFMSLLGTLVYSSCSKEDNGGGGASSLNNLPGTLYIEFATDGIRSYDFKTGKLFKVTKTDRGPGVTGYDFSYGSKEIALSIGTSRTFDSYQDKQTFIMRPFEGKYTWYSTISDPNGIPSKGNIFGFKYQYNGISPEGEFYREAPIRVSPNKRYIAVDGNYWENRGILLLDTQTGKLLAEFYTSKADLDYQSTPVWTLNSELFFAIRGVLYRWKEDYGIQTEQVLNINNGNGASYVAVNPQGTRVAFRYKNHLWVQNIDGSGLQQITTSPPSGSSKADGEYQPVFSPDGKYIAFVGSPTIGRMWTDYDPLQPRLPHVTVVGGAYGYVFIIPDNNKLYDLKDPTSGAIMIKDNYGYSVAGYFSNMIWR